MLETALYWKAPSDIKHSGHHKETRKECAHECKTVAIRFASRHGRVVCHRQDCSLAFLFPAANRTHTLSSGWMDDCTVTCCNVVHARRSVCQPRERLQRLVSSSGTGLFARRIQTTLCSDSSQSCPLLVVVS